MKKNLITLSMTAATCLLILTSCGNGTVARDLDASAYNHYEIDLNNDGVISDSEKGLTWANSYDKVISSIKSTSDTATRYSLMHKAETLLMSTGAICPLYFYTDMYLLKTSVTDFYTSPLGYKFFTYAKKGTSTSVTACIASEPSTVDPALNSSVDGATYDSHLFEGLYCYQDFNGDGQADLVPGLAAAAPTKTENDDGSVTYDFTLRDGIKFSDGTDITASDFVYSWNRAASGALGADYAYMFDNVKNADKVEADETGEEKLGVEASADNKHFKVTLATDVPYFYELCAFPAMSVVKQAAVESSDVRGGWVADAGFVTSGAYTMDSWDHDSTIVLKKNPYYWNASNVTMDTITFALSDDTSNMYTNYSSGAYDMIDDFPTSMIDTLKTTPDYHIQGQLGTYYVIFNVKSKLFADKADTEQKREKVRKALSLFIDRNYIVNSVTKGGQEPANSFVPTGLTDADGVSEFVSYNGADGDGSGYYSVAADSYASNVAEGVEMLKEVGYTYDESSGKFTDFPSNGVYLYNTSEGHKAIGETLQAELAAKGITIKLQNQEWATFLDTRKAGGYDIARNGWLADYNDPISFLDMWTTASGNNDAQFGK